MPRKKKTEESGEVLEETTEVLEETEKAPPETEKAPEEMSEGKKRLLQRAKQLEGKIEEKVKAEEVKIEDPKPEQKEGTLVYPLEDYVRAGIHLGTRVISGDMRSYVYRRRADGLAILNTNLIDKNLHEAAEYISKFKAADVILACKREAGWIAGKKFGEVTGIKVFTKKYPVGLITNPTLADFFEPALVIICDPWLDKNLLNDAQNIRIPVVGLCDTNNVTKGINYIIACNNKSNKSIGIVLYLIAKEYCSKNSLPFDAEIKDFAGEELEDNK
ncbi:MAG: 30S ribosomal protein S2 [archaeon]